MGKENKEWGSLQVSPPKISSKVEFKIKENKGYQSRVLLLNPPTDRTQFVGSDNYFPLGLIMLATVIRKQQDLRCDFISQLSTMAKWKIKIGQLFVGDR